MVKNNSHGLFALAKVQPPATIWNTIWQDVIKQLQEVSLNFFTYNFLRNNITAVIQP